MFVSPPTIDSGRSPTTPNRFLSFRSLKLVLFIFALASRDFVFLDGDFGVANLFLLGLLLFSYNKNFNQSIKPTFYRNLVLLTVGLCRGVMYRMYNMQSFEYNSALIFRGNQNYNVRSHRCPEDEC